MYERHRGPYPRTVPDVNMESDQGADAAQHGIADRD
jgi:hypothetical protein